MSVFRPVEALSSDDEHVQDSKSVAKTDNKPSPKAKVPSKAKASAKSKAPATKTKALSKASAEGKSSAKSKASVKSKASAKSKAKGTASGTKATPPQEGTTPEKEENGSVEETEKAEETKTNNDDEAEPQILKRPSARSCKRPAAGSVCFATVTSFNCCTWRPLLCNVQHSIVSLLVVAAVCPAGPATKPVAKKSPKVSAVYQYSATRKFAVKRDGKQMFQAR